MLFGLILGRAHVAPAVKGTGRGGSTGLFIQVKRRSCGLFTGVGGTLEGLPLHGEAVTGRAPLRFTCSQSQPRYLEGGGGDLGVGILLLPHAVVLPSSDKDLGQLVYPKKPNHPPPQPRAQ